jgi:hypothetical protein
VKSNKINWIEILLRTPIENYRKYTAWCIIAPILSISKNCPDEAFVRIKTGSTIAMLFGGWILMQMIKSNQI